jgi:hypothetical protein
LYSTVIEPNAPPWAMIGQGAEAAQIARQIHHIRDFEHAFARRGETLEKAEDLHALATGFDQRVEIGAELAPDGAGHFGDYDLQHHLVMTPYLHQIHDRLGLASLLAENRPRQGQ